ncbi:MarR family transcriptional regulator [Vibrio hannami]|uniref:MarR family winged helix-turn-helix transcriptional regulator n=1 Tax=Vibrio hannami TaxID=2717094 RepID=UPI00240EAB10|nr:MarR family transcriptional regulator [Vibrio hannami]MDG3088917.1 MarR family transcriptional regulator [Vibrio hannami]
MSLKETLFEFERYISKEWRMFVKEDPLAKLSFNEFDYLKVIQTAKEPIRITDLAVEMMVTKPSASNMVVRLERKGLVRRISDFEDARVKRVELTEQAKKDLSLEDKVYSLVVDKLERNVTKEESERVVEILTKMLKNDT